MAKGPFYTPGDYMCEITSQAIGEASTGTPQIIFGVKVLGFAGEAGELDELNEQYVRTLYLAVTDKRMPYLADELTGFGYTMRDLSPLDPEHPQHVSLVGKIVKCQCAHDKDQRGELRERWQPARGAAKVKPVDKRKMRDLDRLYARSAGAPPAAPPRKTFDPTEITDDDIPL